MHIPTDMHKWRSKFAWEMVGFAALSLVMAAGVIATIWFARDKWVANPAKMLVPTAEMAFVAAVLVVLAFTCIRIFIRTRRHDAKMKEMERNRPPLTLSKLREELRPENQEQFRTRMVAMLQSMPPETRVYAEASMREFVERYKKDLGSSPEVDTDIAILKALTEDVLRHASVVTA